MNKNKEYQPSTRALLAFFAIARPFLGSSRLSAARRHASFSLHRSTKYLLKIIDIVTDIVLTTYEYAEWVK